MTIDSHRISVAGHKAHFLASGTEGAVPVLLLHGASFSSATWQQIGTLQTLANSGFRAYAADLPGFGLTEANIAHKNDWLGRLIEAMALVRPVIVVPSMSGAYAFPFALRNPGQLSGFIAIAPVSIPGAAQLKQLTTPLLALWGENDQTVPVEDGKLLAESVPNGTLVVLPNAGHACYMNDPAAFHAQLLKFLKQLAAARD